MTDQNTTINELQHEIKKWEENKKKAWFDKKELQEKINENRRIIESLNSSEKSIFSNNKRGNKRKAAG